MNIDDAFSPNHDCVIAKKLQQLVHDKDNFEGCARRFQRACIKRIGLESIQEQVKIEVDSWKAVSVKANLHNESNESQPDMNYEQLRIL